MASFQGLEHFLLHFSGREGHKSDMGHNKLETHRASRGQRSSPKSSTISWRDPVRKVSSLWVSVESHVEGIVYFIHIYIYLNFRQITSKLKTLFEKG